MDVTLGIDLSLRSVAGALILAALWLQSRKAARRLIPANDPGLLFLATALIAITMIVTTGMLLGLFGALGEIAWAVTLLLVAWALPRIPWTTGEDAAFEGPPPPSTAFWCGAIGAAFGRVLFALRNPPADWDSLHYHTPMVAHWIVTGTIGAPLRDPPPFGAYFPGASELLQAFAALVLHRETLMTWPAILALPLLALVIRRLALRAGATRPAAEVAGLALIAADCVLRLTLGTRIDLHLALWAALTALFLLEALRNRSAGALALALLAGGLFSGSKGNAPFFLVLLVIIFVADRPAFARELLSRQRAGVWIGLFVGGFWYLRNLWVTGNPLFPAPIDAGPLHLPGIGNGLDLARTTQVAIWQAGLSGHLTPDRLLWNFGLVVPLLAMIGTFGLLRSRLRPATESASDGAGDATRLAAFALCSFVLFLFLPFSGACDQGGPGRPPLLNLDNLRLLLPTLVIAVPAGAALLPSGRAGLLLTSSMGALVLLQLRSFVGHLLPGVLLAALALTAARRWGHAVRPVHAVAGIVLIAAGTGAVAASVDPIRERISDRIWDGYLPRDGNLSAADVRRVQEASAGAPFAVTGVHAWAAYYGRDFSGQPRYIPLDRAWSRGSFPWGFAPDPRRHADRERWLESLEAAEIACVVVGIEPEASSPTPEWSWILSDPKRFEPLVEGPTDRAWRVRRP